MAKIPFEKNSIILAPMAGVTDSGFRMICKKYGADMVVTEMVSSKGLFYNDKKTSELLQCDKREGSVMMQIFGNDSECMKVATEYINNNYSPASIDINMGCPAPKIFTNGDGCALMGDIEKAYSIITAVKTNTDYPVSVKFRSGITSQTINAVTFAKMCENAKADFITVHGRTREQFYSGESDPSIIKNVVCAVKIPVVANGDVVDGKSAKQLLDYTSAYGVMIGRGSLGNPFIFNEIKTFLKTGNVLKHNFNDLMDIALEHLSFTIEKKNEYIAVKEFRKHLMWYFKGISNATQFKKMSCSVNSRTDCIELIELARKQNAGI